MSRIAKVWNGTEWIADANYKSYPHFMYEGSVLYVNPKVWNLPHFNIDNDSLFTGSKVESHNRTIQFRFTVNARNNDLKEYVRRYILGVARKAMIARNTTKPSMILNLQIVGNNFTFQSSFCGSDSPMAGFLKALKDYDGEAFKTIYFRYRDEETKEITQWYKVRFTNSEEFGGIVRLVRDEGDRGYTDFTNKYIATHEGIYKVAFK